MWFNTDEDDLEDGEAVVPPSDKMKSEEDLMEPISKFMERKKCTYENHMLQLGITGQNICHNNGGSGLIVLKTRSPYVVCGVSELLCNLKSVTLQFQNMRLMVISV